MGLYDPDALFIFTSAVHSSLVVFVLARLACKKPTKQTDKLVFSESLVSIGTVANLNPLPDVSSGEKPDDGGSR